MTPSADTRGAEPPTIAPEVHERLARFVASKTGPHLRKVAGNAGIQARIGDPEGEIRDKVLAAFVRRHAAGKILDSRCPVCGAPVEVRTTHAQTPKEAKARTVSKTLRCLGASRHQYPTVCPLP